MGCCYNELTCKEKELQRTGRAGHLYGGEEMGITVDACGRVILDAQVNVLIDTKSKISGV